MENIDAVMKGLSSKKTRKEIFENLKQHGVDPEQQLSIGKHVEMEHVLHSKASRSMKESIAERIALDHLSEIPDYYTRLIYLEQEAKKYWKKN